MIRAVKGTHDVLPDECAAWQRVEAAARDLFHRYGYREIRPPLLEQTELFARGIGTETDIVAKEMYTFDDREDRHERRASLTLRPEATAGIVRAAIEHNLFATDPALKVYAIGPMFRREQPQKGRQRQFHQVNVEAFGVAEPTIDVEVIEMALAYLETCGVKDGELLLNSVGDSACRPAYVETLRAALRQESSRLCADCQRRTETNPLRVLDCKVPQDQPVIESLPRLSDHLCTPCREHFDEVRRELAALGIPYRLNPRLVRGLDYYTRTTFEVTSAALGAQNSVLGGGRYDGLVQQLGGPDVTGIGFALGMERLLLLMPETQPSNRCDVFLALLLSRRETEPQAAPLDALLRLQRDLRGAGLRVLMEHGEKSFKSLFRLADKLGARCVAIMGDEELKAGEWSVRDMARSTQERVANNRIVDYLKEKILG